MAILVDASSIFISSIMAQSKTFEESPELVMNTIWKICGNLNRNWGTQYGELVLCFDSIGNWRKDSFPYYKANRKKNRKESKLNYTRIYEIIAETKNDLRVYSPFKTVEVERCEADDIIAKLVRHVATERPEEKILIVSPDHDFIQLQRYGNVKQFSNMSKKFVKPKINAVLDLQEKIFTGDSGDGVPNVLSEDDCFVIEGGRQTPLTKGKKQLLAEDPEVLGTAVARRIIRNRNMIDLTRTPEDLQLKIMEQYANKPGGNIQRCMTLFTKKRMNQLLSSLNDFTPRV